MSSPRFGVSGLADNPDLESRLLRLEATFRNSKPTIISDADGTSSLPDSFIDVRITGFKLDNGVPGGFTVAWNAVSNQEFPKVSRFEIHVATNSAFTDRQVFYEDRNSLSFVYGEAGEENEFFVRMRIIGFAGRVGPFTGTLNTLTGKVVPNVVVPNATTKYLRLNIQGDEVDPKVLQDKIRTTLGPNYIATGGDRGTYLITPIEIRSSEAIIFITNIKVIKSYFDQGAQLRLALQLDGSPILQRVWDNSSLDASMFLNPSIYSFIDIIDPVSPRVWEFSLKLELEVLYQRYEEVLGWATLPPGTAGSQMTIDSIEVQIIQLLKNDS